MLEIMVNTLTITDGKQVNKCYNYYWFWYQYIYSNLQYSKQIEQLRLELSNRPVNDVESQSSVSVEYIPKTNPYDNDIEIKTSDNIKVKVDETEYKIPAYIKEESRLDKGKIVVEKQSTSTIELTNIVDKLADEKDTAIVGQKHLI